jgi:hypothetical protein
MVTSPAGREPLSIRNGKTAISPTYGASVLFFCQGGRGQRIETAGRLDAGGSGHRTNTGHIGTNVKEWHVRHRRRRSVTDVDECWTHRHHPHSTTRFPSTLRRVVGGRASHVASVVVIQFPGRSKPSG